ncbi:ABC transporter ATP-binding protein [Streptomyces sp. NBC_00440]|uniref:ABC transporter ATP-binding protein n=1 Tax=unclassified Streptomyces TaxID=2593676 RepID=UPI00224F3D54|nr:MULTISPECIES: ABC transporter ATP-binding protein [unclassified Streptomyces]MCX4728150.1 ABC transporter ATP-binding protein [Streptomyces sp. NBC_01306]WSX40694.1 ABC transporter ATP-binding protein [Streptomyces sp. NBC_00963]
MNGASALQGGAHPADAVTFENVTVTFPSADGGVRTILEELNLSIPAGQFVAVVGRSGCGKTTMLNMAAGLVEAADGAVTVLGSAPRAARKRMGFMLARDALLPWRTASGNVQYGLELRGVKPTAERKETASRWLSTVHLADHEKHYPWQLSQGMRQRVALARTWALDPELLLMDEPFAALDVNTRRSAQNEFLDLWQREEHRTVMFVTHDLGEAVALADRVVLMGEGGVLDDVMIDIERPRDLTHITMDSAYQDILERLRAHLRR